MGELWKVTSFVVRGGAEVLLLRHPTAGVQFPAGTVEAGETPEAAARREAAEETGLGGFGPARAAGELAERLAPPLWATAETAPVLFTPGAVDRSWATLRRGLAVTGEREADGFVQVTYEEFDRLPDPRFVSFRLTGWVAAAALTRTRRRFFFVLPFAGEAPDAWDHAADGHVWRLFWAPVNALPALIPPQDAWAPYLTAALA